MRPLICIYVSYFNRLKVLTEVSTKLKKMHFFGQLSTINRKETWELVKSFHFSCTFSTLFVRFIFIFGNSQNSFSCGPHFGPF